MYVHLPRVRKGVLFPAGRSKYKSSLGPSTATPLLSIEALNLYSYEPGYNTTTYIRWTDLHVGEKCLAGSPRGVLGILNSRFYVNFGDLGWVFIRS